MLAGENLGELLTLRIWWQIAINYPCLLRLKHTTRMPH